MGQGLRHHLRGLRWQSAALPPDYIRHERAIARCCRRGHGDDALIMPPSIAPIQAVVMPVASHLDEAVEPEARQIVQRLKAAGIRARLDDRDMRPGRSTTTGRSRASQSGRDRPRDLSNGTFVSTMRTGARRAIRSSTWAVRQKGLDDVSRGRGHAHPHCWSQR